MSYPFYKIGGALQPHLDSWRSYVIRKADSDVLSAVEEHELCHILNARHMGKTSLRNRLQAILEDEDYNYLIIEFDCSSLQTDTTTSEFYFQLAESFLSQIENSLPSKITFGSHADLQSWWNSQANLTSLARFEKFIEYIVLKQTDQKILITFDEIDKFLNLDVHTDDFFHLIRAYYQRRGSRYRRLNFALFGVVSLSNLVDDVTQTPINIGRLVELDGFQFEEAKVLIQGFQDNVEDAEAILHEILSWTGGQPFLTNKLCNEVAAQQDCIPAGHEAQIIQHLVKSQIIHNWESQDKPQHLGTIRDRIERSEHPVNLLELYRRVFSDGSILVDNSRLQSELQLTGLVRRTQEGKLEIYNPIYKAAFNEDWIKVSIRAALEKTCPYASQMQQWFDSDRTDTSRLLRGKSLQEGETWFKEHSEDIDKVVHRQFLDASQELVDRILKEYAAASLSATVQVQQILKKRRSEIAARTNRVGAVIQEIANWSGQHSDLAEAICDWLLDIEFIPDGEESSTIQDLVEKHCNSSVAIQKHFDRLKTKIRREPRSNEIVKLYQDIRNNPKHQAGEGIALDRLLSLGLAESRVVESHDLELHVANKFYEYVLDDEWIEQMLNRVLIDNLFEPDRELRQNDSDRLPLRVYEVYAPGFGIAQQGLNVDDDPLYVLQQLDLSGCTAAIQSKAEIMFERKAKTLNGLNREASLPNLLFERPLYLVYTKISGNNLDQEVQPGATWNDDQVISFLLEILATLKSAHDQGLTHLNLKPANIRRREDGSLALIDFSALKEVYATTVNPEEVNPINSIGTEGYIPPELLINENTWNSIDEAQGNSQEEEPSNRRSVKQTREQWDIYSIGVTAIQMLTSIEPRFLYREINTGELLWRFISSNHSRGCSSEGLARILDKMVHHDPKERYQAASLILQDLEQLRSRRTRMQKLAWADPRDKGSRFWKIAGVVMLCALVGSNFWSRFSGRKEEQQASLEEARAQCESAIESKLEGKTNLIDDKVLAQTIRSSGGCDRYLHQVAYVPSLNFGRFLGENLGFLQSPVVPDEFDPMLDDEALADRIDLNLQNVGRNGLLALIHRGQASIILQDVLDGDLAVDELETAKNYFAQARSIYQDDPLGYFYQGVANDVQKLSEELGESEELDEAQILNELELRDEYLDALARYLLMPIESPEQPVEGGAEEQTQELEETIPESEEPSDNSSDTTEAIDISLVPTEVSEEDFPVLAVLGYLWSQDPRINALGTDLPEIESFEVIQRIYALARQIEPSANSLAFNEAVANAIDGERRTAFEQFSNILENADISEDDELYRFSTIGLILLKIRRGNLDEAETVINHLSERFDNREVEDYLENLQICAEPQADSDCNSAQLDWEELPKNGRELFPYIPMFPCQRNISLASAYRGSLCFEASED